MFFVARNAAGRPTLMHAVDIIYTTSKCGLDVSGWSKKYFAEPIETILCRKCKKGMK